MTRTQVAQAAAGIAAVTVAARVVGFLRVGVFAHTVGPTSLGNTYQTANALPNVVFEIVAGGALAGLVVPVVAGPAERGDAERVRRTASGLLTWTVLLLVPVALVGILARQPLVGALLRGVRDPELRATETALGARMLVVFLPQVVLYGVGVVLTGVLQAHRRFLGPALAPLLSSVVVIGAYLVFAAQAGAGADVGGISRAEELTLSVGTTLGVAVLSLSLLVPLARLRLRLRPTLRLPDGVGADVRRLAGAGTAVVAAQQLALVAVLVLANPQPGAVVVHSIAWTVFLLPWAVVAVPLATSAFPALVAAYDDGDGPAYAATTATTLRSVVVGCALAAGALAGMATPVAHVVGGGQQTASLARAITAFAPGLVGYGVLALLTRALYARRRPGVVAAATAAGFAVAVVADVVLVALVSRGALGLDPALDRVAALGAGNSLGMTVGGLLLVRALRRAAGPSATAGLARVTAVSAAAMVGLAGAGLGVVELIR